MRRELLAKEVQACRQRLERANKLLGGLGGEQQRWNRELAQVHARSLWCCVEPNERWLRVQLDADMENVVGDSLVASCAVAYLGPFTPDFRKGLLSAWHTALQAAGVAVTPQCTLLSTMSEPAQVCVCARVQARTCF